MLVIYNVVVNFFHVFDLVVFTIFLFAIYWFIGRDLHFNARVINYINILFDCKDAY